MGSGSPTTLSDGRLTARWASLRGAGRAGLIPYVTAGFPDFAATRGFLEGAAGAGADIVELGIPWSDPVADGPSIQASSHAALQGGATPQGAFDCLRAAAPGIPVVIFTYLNPVLARGAAAFAADARDAGAAGLLVVDLPAGADPAVEQGLRSSGLPLVRLVAPTTGAARLAEIVRASEGFVYLVARTGVTGAPTRFAGTGTRERVAEIRALTDLPVALGFGIATDAQASEAAELADGVVVGSAIVEQLVRGGAAAALERVRGLRAALDA